MTNDFSNISQELTNRGIPLSEFYHYLGDIIPKPSESRTSAESFHFIGKVGLKLLKESKIRVSELNDFILTIPPEKFSFVFFLQQLLIQDKISIEEYFELEKIPWATSRGDSLLYHFHLKEGRPVFYLEQKTKKEKTKKYGCYEIVEEIAKGGMGVVYKVYHPQLNRLFALKVLSKEKDSEVDLKRFHREIKATAKLQHPYIIQAIDSGIEEDEHYFVMEYVEGTTLSRWLLGKHSLRDRVSLIAKCLEGLQYAHEQGILHRDLKPNNILITSKGIPKIADFGLAKDFSLGGETQKLTNTGMMIGTPAYMSPEQILGKISELSITADIYSMGVCLYETITQKAPFKAPILNNLLIKILDEEPLAPSEILSGIHQDLDCIILKSLEKWAEDRYQSAAEFKEDLQLFLTGYAIKAKPQTKWVYFLRWAKQNTLALVLGILLILGGIGAFGFYQWNKHFQAREKLKIAQENKEYSFRGAFEYAQTIQTKAQKLVKEKNSEKMMLYLQAMNYLNYALSFHPNEGRAEALKLEIGKEILRLSCGEENFALAHYIAQELQRSPWINAEEKEALKELVILKKQNLLKKHQERLTFWIKKLQRIEVDPNSYEEAVFEISQMREQEILKKIFLLIEEGTRYFLESQAQNPILDQFYYTICKIVGRLKHKEGIAVLLKAFERLEKDFSVKSDTTKLQFLILLTKSLTLLKATEFLDKLQLFRERLGKEHLFWKETKESYNVLMELKGMK